MLYQCLHGATETARDEHGMKDVGSLIRVKACVSEAVSAAVTQVNRPLLTELHTGRSSAAATAMINK